MKTATVTWITYNNYGTLLQAYALQQYLNEINIENVIISDENIVYTSQFEKNTPSLAAIKSVNQSQIVRFLERIGKDIFHPIRLIKAIRSFWMRLRISLCDKAFQASIKSMENFKSTRLKILHGKTRSEMPLLNKEFDAFICGSDQIWSTLDRNFDGYFFLDFVTKPKISFAPSVGAEMIPDNKQLSIKKWLTDFFAISSREEKTAKQLKELTGKEVVWVSDPTILFAKEYWNRFSVIPRIRKPYLLCYFLEKKSWYYQYAKAFAKKHNLRIIIIPCNKDYFEYKESLNTPITTEEFVGLFSSASFILTDSYHGSIFSLLFEKDFLYLQRFADNSPISQNIRIYSLFHLLKIENTIIRKKQYEMTDEIHLDYNAISPILEQFRQHSRNYLKTNLERISYDL